MIEPAHQSRRSQHQRPARNPVAQAPGKAGMRLPDLRGVAVTDENFPRLDAGKKWRRQIRRPRIPILKKDDVKRSFRDEFLETVHIAAHRVFQPRPTGDVEFDQLRICAFLRGRARGMNRSGDGDVMTAMRQTFGLDDRGLGTTVGIGRVGKSRQQYLHCGGRIAV